MDIDIGTSTTLFPNDFHCFKNVSCSNYHHNVTGSVPVADTSSLALGLLSWLSLQTGLSPYFLLEGLHHSEGWSSPVIEKHFLVPLHTGFPHGTSQPVQGHWPARPLMWPAWGQPVATSQTGQCCCWWIFAVVISWWCDDIKLNKQSSG